MALPVVPVSTGWPPQQASLARPIPAPTAVIPTPTQADDVNTTPFPLPTSFVSHVRRALNSSVPIFISERITLTPESFNVNQVHRETICGFWQNYDNSNFLQAGYTCASPYTCGTKGTILGCVGGSTEYPSMFTTCSDVSVSRNGDVPMTSKGQLDCYHSFGLKTNYYCQRQHMSGATGYVCDGRWQSTNVYLFNPSEVLTEFKGYTMTYTEAVSVTSGFTATRLPFVLPKNGVNDMLASANMPTAGCLATMATACTALAKPIESIALGRLNAWDLCSTLVNSSCPSLCTESLEPLERLQWTFDTCDGAGKLYNFSNLWVDYQMVNSQVGKALFPWQWRMQYNASLVLNANNAATAPACPTYSTQLAAFAVINLVVLLLSLIVGHRLVVRAATRGCMGNRGSKLWVLMSLVGVCLNVGANVVNAVITRATPGFQHVNIKDLVLLWCSRPRAAWLIILAGHLDRGKKYYTSAAISAIGSELVLQGIGSYYLGLTVNYGRAGGFYQLHTLDHVQQSRDALIMYAGAMLWLVTVGFAFIATLIRLTPAGTIILDFLAAPIKWVSRKMETAPDQPDLVNHETQPQPWQISPWYPELSEPGVRSLNHRHQQVRQQSSDDEDDEHSFHDRDEIRLSHRIDRRSGHSLIRHRQPEQVPLKIMRTTAITQTEILSDNEDPTPNKEQVKITTKEQTALESFEKDMGYGWDLRLTFQIIFGLMVLPWIGQWLFWAGFLRLADQSFCPPKLWHNVGVWVAGSVVSVFFGASI